NEANLAKNKRSSTRRPPYSKLSCDKIKIQNDKKYAFHGKEIGSSKK
ncbi:15327_t:CDS:1, partial [Gigaspora rosea]